MTIRSLRSSRNNFRSIVSACVAGLILAAVFQPRLRAQIQKQMVELPKDKTVIRMTADEMRRFYPIKLGSREIDGANQNELDSILTKAGERVQAFFQEFSNISSKERVLLQRLEHNLAVDNWTSRDFYYLTLYRPNNNKPRLEEYRTDKKSRPVEYDAIKGFVISAGYVSHCLHFHPAFHEASHFRFLGKQTSGQPAYLVAFAQKPEQEGVLIGFTNTETGESTRLPVQGIAWISSDTHQILRLYVNLIAAANRSVLTAQTTDMQFQAVRLGKLPAVQWMPHEIAVTTTILRNVFRAHHRYSDYMQFAVESDVAIEKPKPAVR